MAPFRAILANLTTIVLAVVLAVVVWATAIRANDPVETRTLEVEVETVGMPADADLVNRPPGSALITVQGPVSALDEMLPIDFTGVVDLSNVPYGENELPIEIQGGDEQIEVLSVFPATAAIRLEQLVSRDIPITLQIRGEVARGHRLREADLSPEQVRVSGPASRVNQLAEARLVIFVDNTREDIVEQRRPTFYDSEGNAASVAGLTIVPSEVDIVIPVEELAGFAEKPITVNWIGEPAPGYRLLNVSVEPTSVQVTGSPSQLEGLRVQTEAVDISGLTVSETLPVTLDLPPGISPVEVQPIIVTVEVEPILSSDIVQRPVEIRALGPGLTATLEPAEVRVFLFGPLPVLDTLADDDVRVTVNLLGLISGTHLLEPFVTVSADNVDVRSTQPAQITVIISGALTTTNGLTETISSAVSINLASLASSSPLPDRVAGRVSAGPFTAYRPPLAHLPRRELPI